MVEKLLTAAVLFAVKSISVFIPEYKYDAIIITIINIVKINMNNSHILMVLTKMLWKLDLECYFVHTCGSLHLYTHTYITHTTYILLIIHYIQSELNFDIYYSS